MLYLLSILLVLLSPIMIFANETTAGGWNMGHMMNWPWGGMFMMFPVLMMIIVAVFLIMVINIFRKRSDLERSAYRDEKPLDILKRRYASGEITKEEYDEMKKDLS